MPDFRLSWSRQTALDSQNPQILSCEINNLQDPWIYDIPAAKEFCLSKINSGLSALRKHRNRKFTSACFWPGMEYF